MRSAFPVTYLFILIEWIAHGVWYWLTISIVPKCSNKVNLGYVHHGNTYSQCLKYVSDDLLTDLENAMLGPSNRPKGSQLYERASASTSASNVARCRRTKDLRGTM